MLDQPILRCILRLLAEIGLSGNEISMKNVDTAFYLAYELRMPTDPPDEKLAFKSVKLAFKSVKLAKEVYDRVWKAREILLRDGMNKLSPKLRDRMTDAMSNRSNVQRHNGTVGMSTVVSLGMDLLFDVLDLKWPSNREAEVQKPVIRTGSTLVYRGEDAVTRINRSDQPDEIVPAGTEPASTGSEYKFVSSEPYEHESEFDHRDKAEELKKQPDTPPKPKSKPRKP